MKRLALVPGLLLAAGLAAAAGPRDYARQWPLSTSEAGAYAVTLSEDVYRAAVQRELADVAAFNADGDALAFGPMPSSYAAPPGTWRSARWFFLPREGAGPGAAQDLRLLVRRSPRGELTLDASVRGARTAAQSGRDVLIDVQAQGQQVDALNFEFSPDAPAFSAELRVEASDDLRTWRTVASGAPVALLRQGSQTLLRRQVELDAGPATFLRVRVSGDGAPLPLRAVELRLRSAGEVARPRWLAIPFVRRDGRGFVYRLPARVPAEQLDVQLGADNAVATLFVQSRDAEPQAWGPRGTLTAFRLRGAGLDLVNEPLPLALTREREWRLESPSSLARPPVLRIGYVPERWLLLTQGRAPYVVTAGSGRARREDFPLEALVGQVRAKYGPDWQPPRVELGPGEAAGGEAALVPEAPARARTFVLWAVLALGAGAVIFMVLRLLRSPAPPPAP
jgi:hypothetical protein